MKGRPKPKQFFGVLCLWAFAGCSTLDDLFDREQELRPEDLPPAVATAARQAVSGLVIQEAEIMKDKDSGTVYEVEGRSGEATHKLLIAADGTVLSDAAGD